MTTIDNEQRAAAPPMTDLLRQSPFTLGRDADGDEGGDGLTLDGYGAVFNRVTVVDSWEGRFKEQLAPGSMRKSFRELTPRIQFDHGRHPLVGSIPIAQFERGYPKEEVDADLAPEGGAHVVARLHDNWMVQPVREAIASGSVDGMSFRMAITRETWADNSGRVIRDEAELQDLLRRSWLEEWPEDDLLLRTLKEVRVPEIGPVVWPQYEETSVSVRDRTVTIDLGRLNEPDQQHKLARAVLMADRVEETAQRGTSSEDDAAEHLSAIPRIDRRHAASEVNDVMRAINDTKGRYS